MCKEDGTVLRSIILDECEGAPHEFRGVYRGGLLRTLQSGVPSDCIQYNSAVQSIVQDDNGEGLTSTPLQGQRSGEVVRTHEFQATGEQFLWKRKSGAAQASASRRAAVCCQHVGC